MVPRSAIAPSKAQIDKALARRHLRHFVKYFWDVVEPGRRLVWGWVHDAICDHLEAVTRGEIKELIINMPPRHLKSTIVSVMWPCWEWLSDPGQRWLTASYDKELAIRDCVRSRRIIEHPKYQDLISVFDEQTGLLKPAWTMASDANVKSNYENSATGSRFATAPRAAATGRGGNRIIVDDPHNVKKAETEGDREYVADWWDRTMSSRIDDPSKGARVIVMQRLNAGDLSGYCLEQGTYDHLCLPLLYEEKHPHISKTSLDFVDPRKTEGELLVNRFEDKPEEALSWVKGQKIKLGTYGFVGQMQQRPAPAGGVIFKENWFPSYDLPPGEFDRIFSSWDFAMKGKNHEEETEKVKKPDFVVGYVFGQKGIHTFVLHEYRKRANILESIEMFLQCVRDWPECSKHLIEDKANGTPINDMMKEEVAGIEMVEPKGSKIQRAMAVAPTCESRVIHFPSQNFAGDWPVEALDEITTFPFAANDDRVDALSQGIRWAYVSERNQALRFLDQMAAAVDDMQG